jgi:CheY-like chemotaxis protein
MKKCILIVDDDPEILEMTGSFLRKRDYHVITADNGQTALDTARAQPPDLILTDVLMPHMDGYAFYKELKNDDKLSHIPVLIITGRGKMEDSFKVIGVDGFVTKPFTPEELAGEVQHVFQLTESRGAKPAATPARKTKKILALASDKTVADDMVYQAQRAGYTLETVASGTETVAKILSFLPDLIVVDIQPRDMDGYTLVDTLRRLPHCAEHPIVGYSYYATEQLGNTEVRQRMLKVQGESERFLRAGGTKYIGRYHHQVFITALADLLGKKK